MIISSRQNFLRLSFLLVINLLAVTLSACAHRSAVSVDGKLALSSLITISNAHMKKLEEDFYLYSKTAEARSGNWPVIKTRLAEIASVNVPAVIWFAKADGSYWSVEGGLASGNLTDRPYWSKILKGENVIGDLVVSKSTGLNTAIIAVPVLRPDKTLAGVLGASIYLDKLSQQIKQEMQIPPNVIFYAIDSNVMVALNIDTSLIFTHPKEFTPEISRAFDEMISNQEGIVNYHFRGAKRTVLYRKSPYVGWWYALGIVSGGP